MVLHGNPTSVRGTHLGRSRHADFWNKVVLKETDDVLLLQFLCWGDFRQRWDRGPFPCLQSIKHKQTVVNSTKDDMRDMQKCHVNKAGMTL